MGALTHSPPLHVSDLDVPTPHRPQSHFEQAATAVSVVPTSAAAAAATAAAAEAAAVAARLSAQIRTPDDGMMRGGVSRGASGRGASGRGASGRGASGRGDRGQRPQKGTLEQSLRRRAEPHQYPGALASAAAVGPPAYLGRPTPNGVVGTSGTSQPGASALIDHATPNPAEPTVRAAGSRAGTAQRHQPKPIEEQNQQAANETTRGPQNDSLQDVPRGAASGTDAGVQWQATPTADTSSRAHAPRRSRIRGVPNKSEKANLLEGNENAPQACGAKPQTASIIKPIPGATSKDTGKATGKSKTSKHSGKSKTSKHSGKRRSQTKRGKKAAEHGSVAPRSLGEGRPPQPKKTTASPNKKRLNNPGLRITTTNISDSGVSEGAAGKDTTLAIRPRLRRSPSSADTALRFMLDDLNEAEEILSDFMESMTEAEAELMLGSPLSVLDGSGATGSGSAKDFSLLHDVDDEQEGTLAKVDSNAADNDIEYSKSDSDTDESNGNFDDGALQQMPESESTQRHCPEHGNAAESDNEVCQGLGRKSTRNSREAKPHHQQRDSVPERQRIDDRQPLQHPRPAEPIDNHRPQHDPVGRRLSPRSTSSSKSNSPPALSTPVQRQPHGYQSGHGPAQQLRRSDDNFGPQRRPITAPGDGGQQAFEGQGAQHRSKNKRDGSARNASVSAVLDGRSMSPSPSPSLAAPTQKKESTRYPTVRHEGYPYEIQAAVQPLQQERHQDVHGVQTEKLVPSRTSAGTTRGKPNVDGHKVISEKLRLLKRNKHHGSTRRGRHPRAKHSARLSRSASGVIAAQDTQPSKSRSRPFHHAESVTATLRKDRNPRRIRAVQRRNTPSYTLPSEDSSDSGENIRPHRVQLHHQISQHALDNGDRSSEVSLAPAFSRTLTRPAQSEMLLLCLDGRTWQSYACTWQLIEADVARLTFEAPAAAGQTWDVRTWDFRAGSTVAEVPFPAVGARAPPVAELYQLCAANREFLRNSGVLRDHNASVSAMRNSVNGQYLCIGLRSSFDQALFACAVSDDAHEQWYLQFVEDFIALNDEQEDDMTNEFSVHALLQAGRTSSSDTHKPQTPSRTGEVSRVVADDGLLRGHEQKENDQDCESWIDSHISEDDGSDESHRMSVDAPEGSSSSSVANTGAMPMRNRRALLPPVVVAAAPDTPENRRAHFAAAAAAAAAADAFRTYYSAEDDDFTSPRGNQRGHPAVGLATPQPDLKPGSRVAMVEPVSDDPADIASGGGDTDSLDSSQSVLQLDEAEPHIGSAPANMSASLPNEGTRPERQTGSLFPAFLGIEELPSVRPRRGDHQRHSKPSTRKSSKAPKKSIDATRPPSQLHHFNAIGENRLKVVGEKVKLLPPPPGLDFASVYGEHGAGSGEDDDSDSTLSGQDNSGRHVKSDNARTSEKQELLAALQITLAELKAAQRQQQDGHESGAKQLDPQELPDEKDVREPGTQTSIRSRSPASALEPAAVVYSHAQRYLASRSRRKPASSPSSSDAGAQSGTLSNPEQTRRAVARDQLDTPGANAQSHSPPASKNAMTQQQLDQGVVQNGGASSGGGLPSPISALFPITDAESASNVPFSLTSPSKPTNMPRRTHREGQSTSQSPGVVTVGASLGNSPPKTEVLWVERMAKKNNAHETVRGSPQAVRKDLALAHARAGEKLLEDRLRAAKERLLHPPTRQDGFASTDVEQELAQPILSSWLMDPMPTSQQAHSTPKIETLRQRTAHAAPQESSESTSHQDGRHDFVSGKKKKNILGSNKVSLRERMAQRAAEKKAAQERESSPQTSIDAGGLEPCTRPDSDSNMMEGAHAAGSDMRDVGSADGAVAFENLEHHKVPGPAEQDATSNAVLLPTKLMKVPSPVKLERGTGEGERATSTISPQVAGGTVSPDEQHDAGASPASAAANAKGVAASAGTHFPPRPPLSQQMQDRIASMQQRKLHKAHVVHRRAGSTGATGTEAGDVMPRTHHRKQSSGVESLIQGILGHSRDNSAASFASTGTDESSERAHSSPPAAATTSPTEDDGRPAQHHRRRSSGIGSLINGVLTNLDMKLPASDAPKAPTMGSHALTLAQQSSHSEALPPRPGVLGIVPDEKPIERRHHKRDNSLGGVAHTRHDSAASSHTQYSHESFMVTAPDDDDEDGAIGVTTSETDDFSDSSRPMNDRRFSNSNRHVGQTDQSESGGEAPLEHHRRISSGVLALARELGNDSEGDSTWARRRKNTTPLHRGGRPGLGFIRSAEQREAQQRPGLHGRHDSHTTATSYEEEPIDVGGSMSSGDEMAASGTDDGALEELSATANSRQPLPSALPGRSPSGFFHGAKAILASAAADAAASMATATAMAAAHSNSGHADEDSDPDEDRDDGNESTRYKVSFQSASTQLLSIAKMKMRARLRKEREAANNNHT